MPSPLTLGEVGGVGTEVEGMLDVGGVLDAGGVLDSGGMLELGGTEELSVPEEPGTEESREEDAEVSVSTEPVLNNKISNPTKSRNSTPTVTISMIARLSLWWQGPPQMGHRRRY